MQPSELQALAAFVCNARHEQIGARALQQLKVRILDSLGVALGAPDADAAPEGAGGVPNAPAPAARAAANGGTLVERLSRPHLDFADVYLHAERAFHPSDVNNPLLLAADAAQADGRSFLTATAIAYAIATRAFAVGAPAGFAVRLAIAAGTAKLQNLDPAQAASALAGADAPAAAGAGATRRDESGAAGAASAVASVDWSDASLDAVLGTMTRLHFAHILAQPAIDASLTISTPPVCRPADGIHTVRVKTFEAAHAALGGRDDAGGHRVLTPAGAAASLPYLVAVALLDRQVQPRQFAPDRVLSSDVQQLLQKVSVVPYPPFTAAFPEAMPAQLDVRMADGTQYATSTNAFAGSTLRPFDWLTACSKFGSLLSPLADDRTITRIEYAVRDLDSGSAHQLLALLGGVRAEPWRENDVASSLGVVAAM